MRIDHKFTTLNKYVNAERTNKYIGAKIKRDETNVAYYSLLNKPKIKTPCKLKFTWYCENRRSDADNIAFAKKFIIDGMVKAGLIPNDGMKYVIGFQDEFEISDKAGVRIEVIEGGKQ